MRNVKTAEELSEMLQNYAIEVEGGLHEPYYDDYIVDAICDMQEIFYKEGVEEGRFYQSFMLKTDKILKLFETVEVECFMSGTKDKLKVMSILNVKPLNDSQMMVEFLGVKVRD